MARRGTSLREIARLANIGGDIDLKRAHHAQQRRAEYELSDLTDKAKKAASGDYEGEKVLEAAKFISSFFGPVGKAVSVGLSGIDILADKKKAKIAVQDFKKKRPPGTGAYGDYLSQNFNALLGQVEQSQKASSKQSLLSNLMSMGMKSGVTDKLAEAAGPGGKEALSKILPQHELGKISTEGAMEHVTGGLKKGLKGMTQGLKDKLNFQPDERTLEVLQGLKGKLQTMGEKVTPWNDKWLAEQVFKEGLDSPMLSDYFEFLQPKFQRRLRRGGQSTAPAAPHMQRPSIRRRIG